MKNHTDQTVLSKPRKFLHRSLFVYTALAGIELGGALFVTMVVFPLWASSPEAAMGWKQGMPYHLEEGDFFMFASSAVTLAAIITLIAGWRAEQRLRLWIRLSTITCLIVFIWSAIYFIPVQDVSFKGDAGAQIPHAEFQSRLDTFVGLNYVRQVMVAFYFIAALHALGLSYRRT